MARMECREKVYLDALTGYRFCVCTTYLIEKNITSDACAIVRYDTSFPALDWDGINYVCEEVTGKPLSKYSHVNFLILI